MTAADAAVALARGSVDVVVATGTLPRANAPFVVLTSPDNVDWSLATPADTRFRSQLVAELSTLVQGTCAGVGEHVDYATVNKGSCYDGDYLDAFSDAILVPYAHLGALLGVPVAPPS
jgi:hypothetical protein